MQSMHVHALLFYLHVLLIGLFASREGSVKAPHIIVIVADDLGWASVGYHDDEVQTPFIDDLATKHSLILNRHYVYKYCSPTRSSFLSGRLPLHVNQENRAQASPGGGIHLGMWILPKVLKQSTSATYHTHQFGKWHCGMSNEAYLPVNRGFDTSFGYLSGAESHWTHEASGAIDFWNSLYPMQYQNVYGDLLFNTMAVRTINDFANMASKEEESNHEHRLFMYVALQVVHDPQEAPQEYLDLYPKDMFTRRRSMDAMASVMDDAVKNITNALKQNGLWDDTILLFTADNGGATGVNSKSGNNWPLRGGKHSDFEGGVRAVSFITGGYVPDDRKGKVLDGYIQLMIDSICDWYETFAKLAGVDTSTLPPLTKEKIPALDSLNVWPMIEGSNITSPRVEIPLSGVGALEGSAFISGEYKIVLEDQGKLGFYTGPHYPNYTDAQFKPNDTGCPDTCLFNIIKDPLEQYDLSKEFPEIKQKMLKRHNEISKGQFQTDCYGATVNATEARQIAVDAQIFGVWAPYNMCLLVN